MALLAFVTGLVLACVLVLWESSGNRPAAQDAQLTGPAVTHLHGHTKKGANST